MADAGLRRRHGGDHGAAAARPGRHADALYRARGEAGDRRRPRGRGARMMPADDPYKAEDDGLARPMTGDRRVHREMILEVANLTMRFGGLTAVSAVSFAASRGEITAVIGPNGAGKTTLFNCITGFYRPSSGAIRLHRAGDLPVDLHRLPGYRIARAGVARTFQNIRLFPGMTALENLLIAQHNKLMAA